MSNWSLSKKIWAVLGLLSAAFVFSTVFGLKELMNSRDSLNEITGTLVRRDQLTSELNDDQRLMFASIMEGILRTDEANIKRLEKKFGEAVDEMDKDQKEYLSIASVEGKAVMEKYISEYKGYLAGLKKVQVLAGQNKNAEATEVLWSLEDIRATMRKYLDEMNKITYERLKQVSEDTNAAVTRSIWVSLIISSLSIFLSLLVAFFVLRAVTKAISQVVANLFDSSAQVSSAAGQIASSSEELSQSATEQAASLEQTAASIEEMNSMVGKNSENANSTASTSTKSQEKAQHGKVVVEKMIESMTAINESNNTIMEQVNKSNESMAGIVKVIEEIGSKTKVINDIVFQTKLLSFNASVEAARAGEHGKGFAVVAEEVGNLAQMSGNAAKEISTLLEESVQKVNTIVHETKSSVEKLIADGKETVESGTQVARQCGDVLEEIVQNVSGVSSMAGEIATASQEQARGVGEITKAMGQLDQMTQQNAATSEECASAAEELSAQSEALKKAVQLLVVTVNGTNGGSDTQFAHAEPARPTPVVKKALAPKQAAQNVVHLKTPAKETSPVPAPKLKKASGDVPSYNSAGFEEV